MKYTTFQEVMEIPHYNLYSDRYNRMRRLACVIEDFEIEKRPEYRKIIEKAQEEDKEERLNFNDKTYIVSSWTGYVMYVSNKFELQYIKECGTINMSE